VSDFLVRYSMGILAEHGSYIVYPQDLSSIIPLIRGSFQSTLPTFL
jgi:hypothetical protein